MNVQDRTRLPEACATETWLDETICLDLRRPRSCGCGLRFGVAAAGGDGCLHGRRPRGLTLQALDGRLRALRVGSRSACRMRRGSRRAGDPVRSGRAARPIHDAGNHGPFERWSGNWFPGPIPDLPHSHDQRASGGPLIRQARAQNGGDLDGQVHHAVGHDRGKWLNEQSLS